MPRSRCLSARRLLAASAVLGLALLLCLSGRLPAQPRPADPAPALTLADGWVKTLSWRSIGPANMSGRIVAVSVHEADPSLWYVATASGGLLRTTNNGVTFEHQFDREATVSLGDVCVAPSDKNVVWVGTGEANPRNSASYGDGVYKSTDGGKNWKNMGLKKSFQIGKILIHPTNPDVVYVGAMGRLYGPNEERGLYKTTDGGKNWNKVLHVDDRTGVIDLRMHPSEPDTLIAAAYERQRDGYDFNDPAKKWGPGGGLHKTTDGGKTWNKLSKGLPTCALGRIGLDWYRKDPSVVYAIVESEKIGSALPGAVLNTAYMGITGEDGDRGVLLVQVVANGPADQAGLKVGDLVTAAEGKPTPTYQELVDVLSAKKAGDKLKLTRRRGQEEKGVEVTLGQRPGGQAAGPNDRPLLDRLGGQAPNAQNRQGKDGFQCGGVYRSADAGESWTRINSVNPRPMYFSQVRVDPSDERFLYVCGVSLYRSSDGGRTFTPDGGRNVHADHHALWIDPRDGRHMILGTDGGTYVSYDRMGNWDHLNTMALGQFYHVAVDTRRHYRVYGGLQDNGSWGGPSFTKSLTGPINEDWFSVGTGDGFSCRVDPKDPDQIYYTVQNGGLARRHLGRREQARIRPTAVQGRTYRFNWNTPFILSSHNSKVYYAAGNVVFKSLDRGNDLKAISPEITRTNRGSATALAESPKNANVLYAGTDDGALWGTRDGGKTWADLTKNVGLPGPRWVNSLEASRYHEGRCYAVFDAHRSNDDSPYVYVSEDFGQTWKSLVNNLPAWGTTRVLREDIENPNLLYLGTEFGIWCSLDRGQSWARLNNNLPTVAVHEIAIHPTAGEIVAATHGRSLWVLDVSALRQITAPVVQKPAHLFKPTTGVQWAMEPNRGRTNRRFIGTNPPAGAQIFYALTVKANAVELKVVDADGKEVRELKASTDPGLHQVSWDLARPARGGAALQPGQRQPRQGGGGVPAARQAVKPGEYRVVLKVDGVEMVQPLRVEADPTAPGATTVLEEEVEEDRVID